MEERGRGMNGKRGGGVRRSRSEGMEVEGVRDERWRREEREMDGKRGGGAREEEEERVEVRGEGWGHHCTPR